MMRGYINLLKTYHIAMVFVVLFFVFMNYMNPIAFSFPIVFFAMKWVYPSVLVLFSFIYWTAPKSSPWDSFENW